MTLRLSLVTEMTKHIRVRTNSKTVSTCTTPAALACTLCVPSPSTSALCSWLFLQGSSSSTAVHTRGNPPVPACNCLQSDAQELSSFTPAFLWLLRDFYLRLEDEQGRQVRSGRCSVTAPSTAASTTHGTRSLAKADGPEQTDCLYPCHVNPPCGSL